MKEIWKDIPNYEGKYQASNSGKIRSLDRVIFNKGCNGSQHINGKILAICVAKNGYCVVNLGHGKQQYVHRLICNTFMIWLRENPLLQMWDESSLNKIFCFFKYF